MAREESNAHLDLFPSEATIVRREMRHRIVALAQKHVRWAVQWCRALLGLIARVAVGIASRTAPYVASANAFVSSRLTRPSLPHVSQRGWAVPALTIAAFGSGLFVGASTRTILTVDASRPITSVLPPSTANVALHGAVADIPHVTVVPRSQIVAAPPPRIVAAPVARGHRTLNDAKVAATVTPASHAAKPRAPTFSGSLVVNSRPAGARVFLNGRSAGTTPLVLKNQAAGSRAVRVALDGYTPWSSVVQIVTGAETRLQATLIANPAR